MIKFKVRMVVVCIQSKFGLAGQSGTSSI